MDRWRFYQVPNGEWCWQHLDSYERVMATADMCFKTRAASIADAMRHGYLAQPVKPIATGGQRRTIRGARRR